MATKRTPVKSIMPDEAKWRAESDMRVLREAKEIEANRSRLAAAQRAANEQIKQLQSVTAKKPVRK